MTPNDPHGQFVAVYDGLGNLTQLIDWESAMTAGSFDASTHIAVHYEYSPYGQVVRQTGSYAAENPFRFSTKWFDGETRLGYWGYRYYIPEQGRWLNRDPIGEEGGVNLYTYCINNPGSYVDSVGKVAVTAVAKGIVIAAATCVATTGYTVSELPNISNDKYKRCLASCWISKNCGHLLSLLAGDARELFDELLKKEGSGWSWPDIFANRDGRDCAGSLAYLPMVGHLSPSDYGRSCYCCCWKEKGHHPGPRYIAKLCECCTQEELEAEHGPGWNDPSRPLRPGEI
jgi:RHS repeat-associated protein